MMQREVVDDEERGAIGTGKHRLTLFRRWDRAAPRALFVMENPSTAGAYVDDPTIRRCRGFAKRLGCGGLVVVNLWTYRATDPRELARVVRGVWDFDPSHEWASAMRDAMETTTRRDTVIAAWGAHPATIDGGKRAREALDIIHGARPDLPVWCLGVTASGAPRHPLRVRADEPLRRFA
jgi:hypothetical protein